MPGRQGRRSAGQCAVLPSPQDSIEFSGAGMIRHLLQKELPRATTGQQSGFAKKRSSSAIIFAPTTSILPDAKAPTWTSSAACRYSASAFR